MKDMLNFLNLFVPIQFYLANAPNSPELAEARQAYNTIIEIIYGPDQKYGTCNTGPVKFVGISK
jgi:hypothetical protein